RIGSVLRLSGHGRGHCVPDDAGAGREGHVRGDRRARPAHRPRDEGVCCSRARHHTAGAAADLGKKPDANVTLQNRRIAELQEGRSQVSEFCAQIETYLCRKNDGHLIRVTGPSFDLVSSWAAQGIPLKVAYAGIDRYFERYYRKGPRRRPVRIDFCDADVLDAFDEWRRALGMTHAAALPSAGEGEDVDRATRGPSLPAHLERVVMRLTAARASGRLGDAFDGLIDRVARDLDAARAESRGLRGEARQALIAKLAAVDTELVAAARASMDEAALAGLAREAADQLGSFRQRMSADAFAKALDSAVVRLVRERFGLPTISFQ